MKRCINGVKFIKLPLITYKVEIQKCGQNLCAHKPCFLMLGHICTMLTYTCMHILERYSTTLRTCLKAMEIGVLHV